MSARWGSCAAALLLALCSPLAAQSYSSCPPFWTESIHAKFDCIEALFSSSPAHLTISSVPPGNGFALGGILGMKTHYASPAARLPDAKIDDLADHPDTGRLSLTDASLAGVISTNGSWYTTGSFSWLPPLNYHDVPDNGVTRHKWGPLTTDQVFGIQFYGTHRDIKNLSFFGEGALAGTTEYLFKQTDTYAGFIARLPLTTWLRADGQLEYRQLSLPVDSNSPAVQNNFSEASAPGLTAQPGFMHYSLAADTDQTWRSEPASPKETLVPDPKAPPVGLMKHRFIFRAQNRLEYHWYEDLNTGHYSFRQVVFAGDESVQLGSVFLKFFDQPSHRAAFAFLRLVCGGTGHGKSSGPIEGSFKKDDVCDFGQLEIKTRFVVSQTGTGNVLPFYYQPTLGGSDIDSRVTLRGYSNYRFRGNDSALVQIEYSRAIPAIDPIAAFAFYDGGSVSVPGQSLRDARYRQDGGLGASLRLQAKTVIRGYAAMGAGHGVHFGFNLEKLF